MPGTSIQNESHDLAEQWVLEQIDDQFRDEIIPERSTIEVGKLNQCDCIPVVLRDSRGRRWWLVSVQSAGLTDLVATYKFSFDIDGEYTRTDYEADRADMAHSDGERN